MTTVDLDALWLEIAQDGTGRACIMRDLIYELRAALCSRDKRKTR